MRELPSGTVTFLFTDVEGSTRLLHDLGVESYADALHEHRRVLRECIGRHGGVEVDTQGDAFFFAFTSAVEAVGAARDAQIELGAGPISVRMGLHSGSPHVTDEGYVGEDVHLGARIAAAGHGGQVLLSRATMQLVDAELVDLGEHRVKDFEVPISIFQLGAGRHPPLKTISNTNLPRPASSFVGREGEVAEVVALVRGGARLVTLTGPGGTGKTRLAIEAAAELVPGFKAGVFWVGLAALRDPALVTESIAQTLGAKEELAAHIGEREILLLLDNFEQVVEAAPELSRLHSACPNLRLLVTSRELLRIQGESDFPVPPLAAPEAVELFCGRSKLRASDEIADLCRRLDNLPLAVELAAARASVLSPEQILERLSQRLDLLKGGRDADPRQQTLRATIEWSYELLTLPERQLFAGLSVFSGGCTVDSAEQVAGADLDTLQSLVEKSLVRHTDERFWMLETIREYALERLEESGEKHPVARRHAEQFVGLAERAEPELDGPDAVSWAARLAADHDNLRKALAFARDVGDGELLLRLAGALGRRFWCQQGHLREGRAWLEAALAASESPAEARALALTGMALLAIYQGDEVAMTEYAEAAITFGRSRGDPIGIGHGLVTLGYVAALRGELDRAWALYEESAALARRADDVQGMATAIVNLGSISLLRRQDERALELYLQAVVLYRDLADGFSLGVSLNNAATAALRLGRLDLATTYIREAICIFTELRTTNGLFSAFVAAAALAVAKGHPRQAARMLGVSQALGEDSGYVLDPVDSETAQKALGRLRVELGDATEVALAEGRALALDEAVAVALSID